jgi:hypothetical protein
MVLKWSLYAQLFMLKTKHSILNYIRSINYFSDDYVNNCDNNDDYDNVIIMWHARCRSKVNSGNVDNRWYGNG